MDNPITVTALVNAPIATVWKAWTNPTDIKNWTFASDDWHAPASENDLRVGGKFSTTMAAKDGSMSFDFWGTHTVVEHHKRIDSTMGDERKMQVLFEETPEGVLVTESFEAEATNPREMQQGGWQSILNNFKKYAEKLS